MSPVARMEDVGLRLTLIGMERAVLLAKSHGYEKDVLAQWLADRLLLGRTLMVVAGLGTAAAAAAFAQVQWGRTGLMWVAVAFLAAVVGLLLGFLVWLAGALGGFLRRQIVENLIRQAGSERTEAERSEPARY